MESKKCKFSSSKGCTILRTGFCDGTNKECKFFKTESQFVADRDHSIVINRMKGKCINCKYKDIPCSLSTEN